LKTHKAWPPIQPIPRTLQRAPTDRAIRAVTPTGIVPTQAGGVIAPVVNTPIDVPTTKSPLPVNNTALPSTPRLPAIRPHASVPPFVRLPAAMGARQAQRVRSSPESRRLDRAKLLQHLFVLEQQAERRWRLAMDYMVTKMLIFEEAHIDQT
jgi:phosphatidylserine/phosphatidylglycerophosphate/cardiolipin synthase-like enzyme